MKYYMVHIIYILYPYCLFIYSLLVDINHEIHILEQAITFGTHTGDISVKSSFQIVKDFVDISHGCFNQTIDMSSSFPRYARF
jgi:hypothetical protein